MNFKRITLLCGHYGSGKTNIAVNLALAAKDQFDKVTIADLDIVNPYYRSVDSRELLERHGIRVICSEFANTNLDVPALPQEMYALVDDKTAHAFIDVGGDDRGALALGRLRDRILSENDYDMYLVVNRFRPLTRTAQETYDVMREIETAAGIRFTGILNNSNLGAETDTDVILSSAAYAQELSVLSGLPVVAAFAERSIAQQIKQYPGELIAMDLQARPV